MLCLIWERINSKNPQKRRWGENPPVIYVLVELWELSNKDFQFSSTTESQKWWSLLWIHAAFLVSLYSKFLHSTMAAANNQRSITRPPFWAVNAAGITLQGEGRPWDHTVAALSKEFIQLCFNAVAHLNDDEPYSRLKDDLLQQHTLTKYSS